MRMTLQWLVAGGAMMIGGCATYVNIPRQVGDLASHDANNRNVLAVESQAVKAVVGHLRLDQPFSVQTLPETNATEHLTMMPHIHELARADYQEGQPIIEVKQVYIRGTWARANLVHTPGAYLQGASDTTSSWKPAPRGQASRIVTVDLKWGAFDGWRATHLKVWRLRPEQGLIHVDAAPPIIIEP